jgi:hypothetical protein
VSANDDLDILAPITAYQRRLYDAIIFAHGKGRARGNRVIRALWLSRRRLQAENAGLRARLRLVEALATDAQIGAKSPKAGVRADWINHVLNDTKTPEGFEAWQNTRKADAHDAAVPPSA